MVSVFHFRLIFQECFDVSNCKRQHIWNRQVRFWKCKDVRSGVRRNFMTVKVIAVACKALGLVEVPYDLIGVWREGKFSGCIWEWYVIQLSLRMRCHGFRIGMKFSLFMGSFSSKNCSRRDSEQYWSPFILIPVSADVKVWRCHTFYLTFLTPNLVILYLRGWFNPTCPDSCPFSSSYGTPSALHPALQRTKITQQNEVFATIKKNNPDINEHRAPGVCWTRWQCCLYDRGVARARAERNPDDGYGVYATPREEFKDMLGAGYNSVWGRLRACRGEPKIGVATHKQGDRKYTA